MKEKHDYVKEWSSKDENSYAKEDYTQESTDVILESQLGVGDSMFLEKTNTNTGVTLRFDFEDLQKSKSDL